ncbi:MAG: hypothetical protein IT158_12680 [Bryobacterales bacterium]|nr:hypothetical protein [Bryobacterales bacterium]
MVTLVQPVPLALDRGLYPNRERRPEELFQLDHFDAVGNAWPIVAPADDAVALLRVVSMRLETAGPELELNSDALLGLARMTVGDAVRVSGPDLFNSKLQSLGDVCEKKNDTRSGARIVEARS